MLKPEIRSDTFRAADVITTSNGFSLYDTVSEAPEAKENKAEERGYDELTWNE